MEKIEIVVRFTKDNGKSHEQTIFEWSEKSYVDQKILYFPGLEVSASRNNVLAKPSLPVRESFHVVGVYF